MTRSILHAGLVATRLEGLWRGALVVGPAGAGKSDLALRAIQRGWRLVADDRTIVFASRGRLFGAPPASLRGLLEIRGVGVVRLPSLPLAEIVLMMECATPASIERMPGERNLAIAGVDIPVLPLWPMEDSAPEKLRHAVRHLGAHRQQAYQAARSRRACVAGGSGGPD